jgi:hypothetical protein
MQGCVAALMGACVMAGSASGQPALLSPKDTLRKIANQATLPRCPDVERLRALKNEDARWLFNRFESTGWSNVDPVYGASLNDLLDALLDAARDRDMARACDTLRLVVQDLHVKRVDCRKLGHSRTNIPVRIRTVRGADEVKNWEVYTRWLPAGDRFTTVPKRLRDLSSPAEGSVPVPGEFEIFAKDPVSGAMTEPARVSIGGAETFEWTLPIARAANRKQP